MIFELIIAIIVLTILVGAYFVAQKQNLSYSKSLGIAAISAISIVAPAVLDDAGIHDDAELIENTYGICGLGGQTCRGLFELPVLENKSLRKGSNIIITFEDKQGTEMSVDGWNYDYKIGTNQSIPQYKTTETCKEEQLKNGSAETTCTYKEEYSHNDHEIIYHGKKLIGGVKNYVQITSVDKPKDLFVDWHIEIVNVAVTKLGLPTTVNFDTHKTDDGRGWAPWSDGSANNYTYAINITINASEVEANLIDFPVYVNVSAVNFNFSNFNNSDCTDLRITNSTGGELAREVVWCNTTTGQGEIHFKADLISSSTDTNFTIYYGSSTAEDYASAATYGRNNVWNMFDFVYHFQEDGNNSVGGTNADFSSTTFVDGRAGKGLDFDSSTNAYAHVDANPMGESTGDDLIVFTSFYQEASSGTTSFMWQAYDGSNNDVDVRFDTDYSNNGLSQLRQGGGSGASNSFFGVSWSPSSTYERWVYRANASSTTMHLFNDDSLQNTMSYDGTVNLYSDFRIGNDGSLGSHPEPGSVIDEWRASGDVSNFNDAWIDLDHDNWNNYDLVISSGNSVTLSTPSTPSPGASATLCANANSLQWDANISKGILSSDLTYSESNILPSNTTVCGYTYTLNATGTNGSFTFQTNLSNSYAKLFVNYTEFNSTTNQTFNLINQTAFVNVSVNITSAPLQNISTIDPSVIITVV